MLGVVAAVSTVTTMPAFTNSKSSAKLMDVVVVAE
jgi:hypothetical protein